MPTSTFTAGVARYQYIKLANDSISKVQLKGEGGMVCTALLSHCGTK